MPRKPMVTRTLSTVEVKLLCLNVETEKPFEKTVVLARTPDDKKLLRVVKELAETDTEKVVHIIGKVVHKGLYRMTEQKFIENAEFLPDEETKK